MAKFNVKTPSGFPEFSPAQERVRQHWLRTISEVFSQYGFQSITTPLVEREENLLGKGGNPKEVYALKRVLDDANDDSHSGNALRFDHTVPLALYVARHLNDISFPFKRQAIGPVFRGERAQKGRYRQFDQCDIDVIGSEKLSLANDAEMVAVIAKIFTRLDIGKFMIRINNRKILRGFFESLDIAEDKIKTCLDIVDDLEKLPKDKILANFETEGIEKKSAEKILEFVGTDMSLEKLADFSDNQTFQAGVEELKAVFEFIPTDIPTENYCLDLSIARGLDYYTGTVYETKLIDHPAVGTICAGGRYEDLTGIFTGKRFPGVGISIGLTRLLWQLFDANIIIPQQSSPCQVLIVPQNEAVLKEAIKASSKLREYGFSVETYLEDKKFAKKLDYADKTGVPLVGIIGEDEAKAGTISFKNMDTGNQTTLTLEEASTDLVKLLI